MVVSGAPEKELNHAEKVCDMALDMIEAITDLKDPSTGHHLKIRVGVHSGAVVAGIVGLKVGGLIKIISVPIQHPLLLFTVLARNRCRGTVYSETL